MELKDCAFPLLTDVRIGLGSGADVPGGRLGHSACRRPLRGRPQSRLDLLRDNAPIMIDHGRAINQASPTARVLVVSSPCNTNCLIAMTHAQDVPREHWFALNQVFRSRAISLVAEKARVPVTQVTRLTVWGNNSETAFVDLQNARIGDQPVAQVIDDPTWHRTVLEPGSPAGSPRSSG